LIIFAARYNIINEHLQNIPRPFHDASLGVVTNIFCVLRG